MLHRQFFLDTILRKSSFAGQKFVTPTCWMKFGWFELKQEKREDLNFQGRIVCTAHRNYSYNTVLFLNQRRVHHLAYCVCKMRHMWIKNVQAARVRQRRTGRSILSSHYLRARCPTRWLLWRNLPTTVSSYWVLLPKETGMLVTSLWCPRMKTVSMTG